MCFGETQLDTMMANECADLRAAAAAGFPDHTFGVHGNEDGQVWIVLEPSIARAHLLRFTICRISPCIMVLVEDQTGRRQICSTAGVDDALAFARNAADQAMLAALNAHPAHGVVQ